MRQKIDIYLENCEAAKEAGITFHKKNHGPIWKSMDEFALETLKWLEASGLVIAGYDAETLLNYYKVALGNDLLIKRAILS